MPCPRNGRWSAIAGRALALALALATLAGCTDSSTDAWELSSPSGEIVLQLQHRPVTAADGSPVLRYRVTHRGEPVLTWSELGLVTETTDYRSGLSVSESGRRQLQDSYTTVVGKRRQRQFVANELTLQLQPARGEALELVLRAHDDGVAFRYRLLGQGEHTVTEENTSFAVAPQSRAWIAPYSLGPFFQGVYEQRYQAVDLDTPSPGTGWAFPALFQTPGGSWMLITEAGLDRSFNGTRLHEHPKGGVYRIRFPSESESYGTGPQVPTSSAPWTMPWRVMLIGELSTVVESTLVDDLSPPSTVADTSWIAPGRSAWSWLTQQTGDPALQRKYVDFAAEMGWEYVLVDAHWDEWPDTDSAVQQLVSYASQRGVRILLWYNSAGEHSPLGETPRDLMHIAEVRQQEMDKISGWGVAGVKVDFFESDKQDRIQQFLDILDDAAPRRLLVNFHGCTLPRGWQRTYPQLMAHEAVQGAEYYRTGDGPDALDNVRDALIRNVVGSMDYTPVTFALAYQRRQISYAQQLALPVLFESGITHVGDRADGEPGFGLRKVLDESPFAKEILSQLPSTWDETRLLAGDPDAWVALARRRGETWYLAAINGTQQSRPVQLTLSFLGQGSYEGTLVTSGAQPTELAQQALSVTVSSRLTHTLEAKDGLLAVLRPAAP